MRQLAHLTLAGVALMLCAILAPPAARAAVFPVTPGATADAPDAIPGNGVCLTAIGTCTLRAAIQEANALPGGNVIRVPAGTYTLTIPEPASGGISGGDLDVTDTLAIEPASNARPEIASGGAFRVFDLDDRYQSQFPQSFECLRHTVLPWHQRIVRH